MKKLVSLILITFTLSTFASSVPTEVEIESKGESIKVSIYELPKKLIIKPLYTGRNDLNTYKWLKPLLFTFNAYGLETPKSEWPNYWEGKWTKARYTGVEKALKRLKKACLQHPKTWGNEAMYSEFQKVALCKIGNTKYLQFYLHGKKTDGTSFGGRTKRLKLVNGKWVNPYSPDGGFKLVEQLHHCYSEAIKQIKDGKLSSIPISKLK